MTYTPERYAPLTVPLSDDSGHALGGGEWAGGGYPILGVPGLGSNHRVWDLLARHLPDHRLVSVDARGRASGFGIASPNGITTHADDLVRVLDATGIDKAVVVGHSMGGFVSTRFAQRHPDRVAGLLLLDGGPPVKLPPVLRSPWALRLSFNRALPKPGPYASVAAYWAKAARRAATYQDLGEDFLTWMFDIDLAGPPGALLLQQDRALLINDAIECFTADWQPIALAAVSMPCRLLLASHGATHKKPPLYRKEPAPDALSPSTTVERLPGADHLEVVWHPRTIEAVTALVPA